MTATHKHYLLVTGDTTTADIPASMLAYLSRGRLALAGDMSRPERNELADVLGEGALCELLRSNAAILVASGEHGYTIWEPGT